MVRASCSVPGLIQPVALGGRRLADGGITDNVPVDAARLLGADYVIGVNIFGGLARKRRGPMAMGFAALETMVRWSGGGLVTADCLISPAIDDLSYVRFAHRDKLIALGRAARGGKAPGDPNCSGLVAPTPATTATIALRQVARDVQVAEWIGLSP